MKIEDEIKQTKPFKSQYQKAAVNLMFTNGWLMDRMRNIFDPYNITVKQYNILRILNGAGKPISTSVIRDRLIDKMSDTPRIIERMIAKGLVEKQHCKSDKRLVDITISKKGKAIIKEINKNSTELDGILAKLNKNESKQLNELLDKIRS